MGANRVYFFQEKDADTGVFIGAKTWKEARSLALRCEEIDCDFIKVEGHLCRQDGKPVVTAKHGQLDAHELMEAGYTHFWWEGVDCKRCGEKWARCHPLNGKLVCDSCIYEAEEQALRDELEALLR